MTNILVILTALFAILALLGLMASIRGLRKRRLFLSALVIIVTMLMLSLSALFGTISISIQGYRALTKEELAAVVQIEPTGKRMFTARFVFPDHTVQTFSLAGDQLYVDARILKWKPMANLFGLHTFYELDRVGGRYTNLWEETSVTRTVFALSKNKLVDLFHLRRRLAWLSQLVDAEYGSATFIGSDQSNEFNIMVSTTGLLIRKTGQETGPPDATMSGRHMDTDRQGIQAAPDPN